MDLSPFIVDHTLALPASMGKSARMHVEQLRIAYRHAMHSRAPRSGLNGPEAIASLLAPLLSPLIFERMVLLPLDVRCRLIGDPITVSEGDDCGCDAPLRKILRLGLTAGAASIVLTHNHPTGDPSPSAADIAVTRRVSQACAMVDMRLNDHIVIGSAGNFTSIRRNEPQAFS
jgi:DNA repair protein RadC